MFDFSCGIFSSILCLLVLFCATSGSFLTSLKCRNSEVRILYHYTFNTAISHTFERDSHFCFQERNKFESCISDRYIIKLIHAVISKEVPDSFKG